MIPGSDDGTGGTLRFRCPRCTHSIKPERSTNPVAKEYRDVDLINMTQLVWSSYGQCICNKCRVTYEVGAKGYKTFLEMYDNNQPTRGEM